MTTNEKELLYDLLKTASDSVYGYPSPSFSAGKPLFRDDAAGIPDTGEKVLTEAENGRITIADIAAKISECRRCQLCKTRTHVVPGEGIMHPAVLVIGEGPGAEEDATGHPFVGPAGQLLDKMLAAISLDRHTNCFIANIVKCRPPGNRTPEPEEAEACRSFLEAQIHALNPAMILALGRTAAQNLLHTTTGITQLRNQFHTCGNIPLLVTYHPSALLRNPDWKRPAWDDLKLFRSKLEQVVPEYAAYTDKISR